MTKLTKPLISKEQVLFLPYLKQTKKYLINYLYGLGVNAVFLLGLQDQEYISFSNDIIQTIKNQFFHFLRSSSHKKQGEWVPFLEIYSKSRMADFFSWLVEKGKQSAKEKLDLEILNFEDPSLENKISERMDFLSQTIDKIGQEYITKFFREGITKEISGYQLVNLLEKEIEKNAQEKGELIAKAELETIMNMVEYFIFMRYGIKKVFWKTGYGEKGDCLANERMGIVNFGEYFPSHSQYPPVHLNCSCYLMPIRN